MDGFIIVGSHLIQATPDHVNSCFTCLGTCSGAASLFLLSHTLPHVDLGFDGRFPGRYVWSDSSLAVTDDCQGKRVWLRPGKKYLFGRIKQDDGKLQPSFDAKGFSLDYRV